VPKGLETAAAVVLRQGKKRQSYLLRKEANAEGRDPNEIIPFYRYEDLPKFGMSAAQLADNREQLVDDLRVMRDALAMSDISAVEDHVAEALDVFGINLDLKSPSYLTLGAAVLRETL